MHDRIDDPQKYISLFVVGLLLILIFSVRTIHADSPGPNYKYVYYPGFSITINNPGIITSTNKISRLFGPSWKIYLYPINSPYLNKFEITYSEAKSICGSNSNFTNQLSNGSYTFNTIAVNPACAPYAKYADFVVNHTLEFDISYGDFLMNQTHPSLSTYAFGELEGNSFVLYSGVSKNLTREGPYIIVIEDLDTSKVYFSNPTYINWSEVDWSASSTYNETIKNYSLGLYTINLNSNNLTFANTSGGSQSNLIVTTPSFVSIYLVNPYIIIPIGALIVILLVLWWRLKKR